jgi:hypothetical protein
MRFRIATGDESPARTNWGGYFPALAAEDSTAAGGPMRASMGLISGFAMKFFQMSPLR